jgi:hypothetical protein
VLELMRRVIDEAAAPSEGCDRPAADDDLRIALAAAAR